MARQNNEDPAVSQSLRKLASTRTAEPAGGDKGVPVNQQVRQLELFAGTAEYLAAKAERAVVGAGRPPSGPATRAVPKPGNKDGRVASATMEEVTSQLREAFRKVASNRGAPGPDEKSIDEVREHLEELIPELSRSLLEGTYQPGSIRRVWIQKTGGGQRGLGIPDVIDRTVQEAVRRVLEPVYEPTFHEASHGFRLGRSCHTAIAEARTYVEEGDEWTVDLDREKFFDRVSHQRLLARAARRVTESRPLVPRGRQARGDLFRAARGRRDRQGRDGRRHAGCQVHGSMPQLWRALIRSPSPAPVNQKRPTCVFGPKPGRLPGGGATGPPVPRIGLRPRRQTSEKRT